MPVVPDFPVLARPVGPGSDLRRHPVRTGISPGMLWALPAVVRWPTQVAPVVRQAVVVPLYDGFMLFDSGRGLLELSLGMSDAVECLSSCIFLLAISRGLFLQVASTYFSLLIARQETFIYFHNKGNGVYQSA